MTSFITCTKTLFAYCRSHRVPVKWDVNESVDKQVKCQHPRWYIVRSKGTRYYRIVSKEQVLKGERSCHHGCLLCKYHGLTAWLWFSAALILISLFFQAALLQTLLLIIHISVAPWSVLQCNRRNQRMSTEATGPLGTSDLGLRCLLLAGGCSEGWWDLQIEDDRCCATQGIYEM